MHIKLKVKSSKPERLRASGVIIYIRTVAKKKTPAKRINANRIEINEFY